MRTILIAAIAALASACTPSMLIEYEHVSHPGNGWPIEPQHATEDALNNVNVMLRMRDGDWYADAGLGWNVYGENGTGFKGSALTGTIRVGREFKFRRRK